MRRDRAARTLGYSRVADGCEQMDTSTYVPLIILAAVVITVIFTGIRRLTGASSRNEIEASHITEALSATVQRETRIATSDEGLADQLLPSDSEAMILPLGAPMEREFATFEGPLSEVRLRVVAMSSKERAHIAIWTPGHIFSAEDLLAERPDHEHDPLPPLPLK